MPNKAGLIALAQHRLTGGPLYSAVINTHLCPIRRVLLLWHSTAILGDPYIVLLSTLIYAQSENSHIVLLSTLIYAQ